MDYRNIYSAKRNLGGGVILDLIHEWDYLVDLFGVPQEIVGMSGRYSDLEINTEDVAVYIARYQDKILELHLDYFGRQTIRKMELFCKDDRITVDLVADSITYYKNKEGNQHFINDEFYVTEMNSFIDMVLYKAENVNSIEQALVTLKTANKCELKEEVL